MEQQQPTNNAAAHCRPRPSLHPFPDPKLAAQPSAIQNISHRFSKLYAGNHRRIGLKPYPIPHPQPEPELFKPSISDNFCAVLTKSSSQHERKSSIVKVTDKKPKSGKRDLAKLMFKGLDNEETPEPETGVPEPTKPPPSTAFPFGRRSFCSSQVEIMEFFSSSGAKALAVDMAPFMQIHAVDCARKTLDSLEKFTSKTLALTIKKEFDGAYGPAWHCIVGTSFGSFVTHSVGGFIYFSLDRKFHILLFKTAVQRAD